MNSLSFMLKLLGGGTIIIQIFRRFVVLCSIALKILKKIPDFVKNGHNSNSFFLLQKYYSFSIFFRFFNP